MAKNLAYRLFVLDIKYLAEENFGTFERGSDEVGSHLWNICGEGLLHKSKCKDTEARSTGGGLQNNKRLKDNGVKNGGSPNQVGYHK